MSEILIKAVDATHADPEKDQRGCYKRGMPVVVMPDGHTWGSREGLPTFVVLKLPGVSVEKVQQFISPEQVDDGVDHHGVPKWKMVRVRLWKVFVDEIPLAVRNLLGSQGSLTIGPSGDYTWTQFRGFLRKVSDGAIAPEIL